ncbi:hypothetical protein QEG11_002515 [Stenotrophomonas maltophilia]|nr:hypothetical protein [Stenotrophomonas maltophilia]
MKRERNEPTFNASDLQDLQFRRERTRPVRDRSVNDSSGLIWKVALGVFLGMSACGLATCTVLGSLGYAVQKQQEAQVIHAIDELNKIANDPDPMGFAKLAAEKRLDEAQRAAELEKAHQPPPLGPNERCIDGTRLRRVENGWMQSGSCR